MISCYPFLLCFIYFTTAFVSGNDHNCTDYPVFTPSRLVVKYGDPANATCVPCQKNCHENSSGLEYSKGNKTEDGATLLWTIDRLTEWDIFIMCYHNTDDGDQCSSNLNITVYQPPKSVSISFVNHTGPMFEHQQYRLQCSVQNVAPVQNLTVTFYRGTKALDQLKSNSEEKKAVNKTFTLDITASKENDGVLYWCEAKLELGPDGPQPPPVARSQTLTASVYCEFCTFGHFAVMKEALLSVPQSLTFLACLMSLVWFSVLLPFCVFLAALIRLNEQALKIIITKPLTDTCW